MSVRVALVAFRKLVRENPDGRSRYPDCRAEAGQRKYCGIASAVRLMTEGSPMSMGTTVLAKLEALVAIEVNGPHATQLNNGMANARVGGRSVSSPSATLFRNERPSATRTGTS